MFFKRPVLIARIVLALSASLTLSTGNVLAISLDDFSTPQNSVVALAPTGTNASSVVSSKAVGGTRSIYVEATDGALGDALSVLVTGGALGKLNHSHNVGVTGFSQIHWDGDSNPNSINKAGLGGIDLTQDTGDGFIIKNVNYDFPNNASTDIIIRVYNANQLSSSFYVITLSMEYIGQDIEVPFANFTNVNSAGLADFKNAGAIEIFVDGVNPSIDLSFSSFSTNGPCPLYPDAQGNVLDECGECLPPTSPDYNKSCADCLGVPNGTTLPGNECKTGEPGLCESGYYNNACDCEREFNPGTEKCDGIDNDCDGDVDETFPQLGDDCSVGEDECRVEGTFTCDDDGDLTCDADFDPADLEKCSPIIGCDGIPGSSLVPDRCGVCGGDGTTCDACDSLDITDTIFQLDGGAKAQEQLINFITRPIRRTGKKNARNWVKEIRAEAHDLQLKNWILSWTIPQIVLTCPDTETQCIAVSNEAKLTEYIARSEELRDLGLTAAKRLRKIRNNNRVARRWKKRVRKQHRENLSEADVVPLQTQSCS